MKYGLSIAGKMRVFAKTRTVTSKDTKKKYDVTDHWVNVSEKEEDGSYYNKSLNLIFGREADRPVNNAMILISDGFLMITGTGEYRRIALFVREWTYEDTQVALDAADATA